MLNNNGSSLLLLSSHRFSYLYSSVISSITSFTLWILKESDNSHVKHISIRNRMYEMLGYNNVVISFIQL